jgi:hypothetical protein
MFDCLKFKLGPLHIMMYQWARPPVLLTTLLVLFLSTYAMAHTVEVGASKKECFFEDLHTHDQVVHNSL